ncbi:MAG: hypothetical protein P8R42_14875 [Candidatus Binatia bacterium]|nr:hypothetical protein [Candidatus Binatia bacterium]
MTDQTEWRDGILAGLRDESRRQRALESLGELDPSKLGERIDSTLAGALVLLLGDPSRTRQRRAADALQGLVVNAPALADALQSALTALDPRLRWGAAYTIGHAIHPPPAKLWPAVREALALDDGDQRWAAAELTCKLARTHPDVRADIVHAARDGSPTLRRMLLYCLRDLADPELLATATASLSDDDAGVRLAALAAGAQASRTPGETSSLADTIAGLVDKDPDPGVRRAAAATLGKLGASTERGRAALARAIGSADRSLTRAATNARKRLSAESEQN